MANKLKSLSFFSGCLGLDLGLEENEIENILFCENDKFCRETISKNKPNVPLIENILDYSASDIRNISGLSKGARPDIIVGGPPCQAFSTAGKRESFKDPRGNVFLYFVKIIGELQPNYFVIENVRGLLSAPLKHRPHNMRGEGFPKLDEDELPGGALNYVLSELASFGYEISFNLYNSANYGVPQIRERVIIIGSLNGGRVPYLRPTHSQNGEYDLEKWKTFRDASKGLSESKMDFINFPEKRIKYYKLLKAGQNWKNLPSKMQIEAMGKSFYSGGGKTGFYRRLAWDKPSPTVPTHPAMPATDLCHPERNRPLSVQEYKRIQQIPDKFVLFGNLIQQYKQLGNAVPVGLGKAIGKTIIDHTNGSNWSETQIPDFKFSRYKNTNETNWKHI
tara:strand:+ start:546 stop:1721 length:1176 start_codon:yes stop_codon:yes gene_type:complete